MLIDDPSKHLLVFKTSSIRLQRNNFSSSKTSWRRLEDVLQIRFEDVLKTSRKTSWRRLGRQKIVTLKTSWRHVLKTSWRHVLKTSWRHVLKMSWRHVLKMSAKRLGDKQNVFWSYLYLTNLNVYLTNLVFHKPLSDESKGNPKCVN